MNLLIYEKTLISVRIQTP